jgi:osmotically-inducible protein OsmY
MTNEKRDLNQKEEEKLDRESWDRWMDTVRANQKDPDEGTGSVGGTPYEGGVFTTATYGSGAEYYSVTGMYENPLLEKKSSHEREGKAPKDSKRRSDEEIHSEICARLRKHPLIDAGLMDVHVEEGDVILTGEVLDRRMRSLIEDVADEIPGVREVHNHLRVYREGAA